MPTQFSYRNLPFKALHDSFTWNLHPFLDDLIPDTLEKSIIKVGILHPPVVVQTGADTYDIVCGRKRIQCGQKVRPIPFSLSYFASRPLQKGHYSVFCWRIRYPGIPYHSLKWPII